MKGLEVLSGRNGFARAARKGRGPRWLAATFSGSTMLAVSLVASSCQQPTSDAGTADPALLNMDAAFTTYSMDSYLTTDGVRSGQVFADTASYYEETGQWRMLGVRMTVFDEMGASQAPVVADSGRLTQNTEQMTAWGNVRVELPTSSCTIESSELDYDPVAGEIRTTKPVTFRQGGRVTTGSGFRSDLRFERFSISSPVGPANVCTRSVGAAPPSVAPGAAP
jgi:LPS export ABC transporter protein LptC